MTISSRADLGLCDGVAYCRGDGVESWESEKYVCCSCWTATLLVGVTGSHDRGGVANPELNGVSSRGK